MYPGDRFKCTISSSTSTDRHTMKKITVMILSFRTYMPGQTEQPQIRLLLIRVYTVCHFVCIVWIHFYMVEPHSSSFKSITTNLLGVRIFRKFTVAIVEPFQITVIHYSKYLKECSIFSIYTSATLADLLAVSF